MSIDTQSLLENFSEMNQKHHLSIFEQELRAQQPESTYGNDQMRAEYIANLLNEGHEKLEAILATSSNVENMQRSFHKLVYAFCVLDREHVWHRNPLFLPDMHNPLRERNKYPVFLEEHKLLEQLEWAELKKLTRGPLSRTRVNFSASLPAPTSHTTERYILPTEEGARTIDTYRKSVGLPSKEEYETQDRAFCKKLWNASHEAGRELRDALEDKSE